MYLDGTEAAMDKESEQEYWILGRNNEFCAPTYAQ